MAAEGFTEQATGLAKVMGFSGIGTLEKIVASSGTAGLGWRLRLDREIQSGIDWAACKKGRLPSNKDRMEPRWWEEMVCNPLIGLEKSKKRLKPHES